MRLKPALAAATAAVLALGGAILLGPTPALAAPGDDVALFDSTHDPLPPSTPSLAFETQKIHEYGSAVELGGSLRLLDRIEVGFVSWACEEGYYHLANNPCATTTPGSGFTHPITVNLYEEGPEGAVGDLIGTLRQDVLIPHRPSADPVNCPGTGSNGGKFYDAASGTCHGGLLFVESFDFSGLNLTLPDRLIVTATFDTSGAGHNPIGPVAPGDEDGFNVLNMAIGGVTPAHVGTAENAVYINASASWWDTEGELLGPVDWGSIYQPHFALYATIPPQPAPEVDAGEWVDEEVTECDATTVERTREVTTTAYVWDGTAQEWVLDTDNAEVTTETGTRDLTPEEIEANACDREIPPQPDPWVYAYPWDYESITGCGATQVWEEREIVTTGYVWDEDAWEWVLDRDNVLDVTYEERVRDLTPEEIEKYACEDEDEDVDDENLESLPQAGSQDLQVALLAGGALALIGAGAIIAQSVRRRRKP